MTRRIPAAAALLALLTALCVVTAMAAGAAVELPVRVTVSGDAPDVPEVFTLTLRAASDSAPLPEGSRNGAYTCAVSGGGSAVLTIPCTREGRHVYTLRQEAGQRHGGQYDDRVYYIAITVTPEGRTAAVYGDADMQGGKYDVLEFRNRYRGGRSPGDAPTVSPQDGGRRDGGVRRAGAGQRGGHGRHRGAEAGFLRTEAEA